MIPERQGTQSASTEYITGLSANTDGISIVLVEKMEEKPRQDPMGE